MDKDRELVFETIYEAFNGKPVISVNVNKVKDNIQLVSCKDRPYSGLTSMSTLGLNNYDIGFTINDTPLRIEIVGVCYNDLKVFQKILYDCSLHIAENQSCSPGAIINNIVDQYLSNSMMKHILFVQPFLWSNKLEVTLENKQVTWLHAIPISESELLFAGKNGIEALEALFEENRINIADLMRQPVI